MELKFEMAVNEYLEFSKVKLKNSTYETNQRKIKKYILTYFQKWNIYDLTTKDYLQWQMYINSLNFKYNYKSSLHYCFTDFLDFCIAFYNLKENVAKKVGNFRNDDIKRKGNVWTIEEFNQFISVVDDKIYNTLFKLLYFTGVRKGEALALTFDDIDFNNKTIDINKTITRYYNTEHEKIITTPKTRTSIRIISIDDSLVNELFELKKYYIENYKNYNTNFFVFGGNSSIPFTTLERKKNNYCDIANVKRIKIHEFRHSHACLLFTNKIEIENISYRLGHSSISMTMDTYLRYLPRNEKRVISTLNSLRLN